VFFGVAPSAVVSASNPNSVAPGSTPGEGAASSKSPEVLSSSGLVFVLIPGETWGKVLGVFFCLFCLVCCLFCCEIRKLEVAGSVSRSNYANA